jgi:hypothetical protein
VLHDDVVGAVPGFTPVIDGDYVRVGERGGALGLALEALDYIFVVSVLLPELLEGHVAV